MAAAALSVAACGGGAPPTRTQDGRVEASFELADSGVVTCDNYPGYMFRATVRNGSARSVRIGVARVLHRNGTTLASEGNGEGTACQSRDLTWPAPTETVYPGGSLTFRWGTAAVRWRPPYTGRLTCAATNQLEFEVLDGGNDRFVGAFTSPEWPLRMDLTPACGERLPAPSGRLARRTKASQRTLIDLSGR